MASELLTTQVEENRVEELLAELSAEFVNLPADRLDHAIEQAQRMICECMDLDRSTLWLQPAGDPNGLQLTHLYRRASLPAPEGPADGAALFPWTFSRLARGHTVAICCMDDLPTEAAIDRQSWAVGGTCSRLVIPLSIAGAIVGALSFASLREERPWPRPLVKRLELLAQVFANAIARARADKMLEDTAEKLRQAQDEIKRLRDQLQQENVYLRREVEGLYGNSRLIGRSRAIRDVLAQAEQVATTDSTVLLLGETGTGKELIASAIHEASPRRGRPMVRVNCAAIPASLIESELFGREKGAYTGALSRQMGRFEMANGSTLFLDEIGDLPSDVQVKLLRVLQDKQIERLGSSKSFHVDVRIIAATNRDLAKAVREAKFREDLYYRLNVFPITVPPLRERREDIVVLVSAFVEEFASRFGKNIESVDKESLERLQRYPWPGNVRELRNVVERAMIAARGPKLRIDSPGGTPPASTPCLTMRQVEQQHIRNVLDISGWRIRGRNGAAEILGLKPSTLESRMARLDIRRCDRGPTK